jgi:hypothetical protein
MPPGFVEDEHMIRKPPLDLPPQVARGFVEAMRDYFAEENPTKRDAIAVHQLSVLGEYQDPLQGKLRLSDIKAMFRELKDQA